MNRRRIRKIWADSRDKGMLCREWGKSFELFFDWSMKNGYDDSKVMEMVNGKVHSPSNSLWVGKKRLDFGYLTLIEYKGEVGTVKSFADRFGLHPSTVKNRLNRDWTVEEALEIEAGNTNYRVMSDLRNKALEETGILRQKSAGNSVENGNDSENESEEQSGSSVVANKIKAVWRRMMYSCYDEKYGYYKTVGLKGIKVCDEWKEFDNFKKWCEESNFKPWHSLGRVNEDEDFCGTNCYLYVSKYGVNNTRASYGMKRTIDNEIAALKAIAVSIENMHGESMLVRNDIITLGLYSKLYDRDSIKALLVDARNVLDSVESLKSRLESVKVLED